MNKLLFCILIMSCSQKTSDKSIKIAYTNTSGSKLEWADSTPYKKFAGHIYKGNKIMVNAFFERDSVHMFSGDWNTRFCSIQIDSFLSYK